MRRARRAPLLALGVGFLTLCVLGYLLERIIEVEPGATFETARKLFARLRAAELIFDDQRVWRCLKCLPSATT